MMGVVQAEQIGLRYDQGAEVLSDLRFTIPEQGLVLLTGPSGSGKTSLIRLLALEVLPGRGRLSLFGRDVHAATRHERARIRRKIGVIWQDFKLISNLSVFENVALPLRLAGHAETGIRQVVTETLHWVGLAAVAEKQPVLLSGGQQQRVAIARAVIARPKLIIADEPTGDLDDQNADRVLYLLSELNRLGTAVVIATHALSVVNRFPQAKHFMLDAGRLEVRG